MIKRPKHPKHRELSRHLRNEIAAGRYPGGSRLPSETELVKQFVISRPTVARAFRDLQNEGLIERRAGSGTYVCSGGPGAAAALVRQLGLLVPGQSNTDVFEHICGELASLARAQDYSLLWGGSTHSGQDLDGSLEHARELCKYFIERKVNGVFFTPYELVPEKESANFHLAEKLRKAGIPIVLLDRDIHSFPHRSSFDLVGIDHVAAGYLLAEHLIKLGCRHIHFVALPLSAPTVEARINGVREALLRHRIEIAPNWIYVGDPRDAKFVRTLTAAKRTDAFICHNDHTAALLLRSLDIVGQKVPHDVRVVGFDDAKYATLVSPPLTTIHQPRREIAVIALRTMLERIADPAMPVRSQVLTPRLVVRESCGAYLPK
ncbi:MAG: GntR family transcriptional regulator [Verrucomicrobiota bacterium]